MRQSLYSVDSHTHLWHPEFKFDLANVIKRAQSAGIKYVITLGVDIESSLQSLALSSKFKNVFAGVGYHPHNAKDFSFNDLQILAGLLKRRKVVVFGEIGLDYYRQTSSRNSQILLLDKLLKLWQDFRHLPIAVHNRNADDDILAVLDNIKSFSPKVIMHCFSQDLDFLKKCLKRGFYISYATNITFKNYSGAVFKNTPLERMLLETDSPYLAPDSKRGFRNEPAYLLESVKIIAREKHISEQDVLRSTAVNSKNIFGIGSPYLKTCLAYKYRGNIYVNLTNKCSNKCNFCLSLSGDYFSGYCLKLKKEPALRQFLNEILKEKDVKDLTFCGFGEPFCRFDILKDLARILKNRGYRIRIVTNGQGNLIQGRNVLPEIKDFVDKISVSLNFTDKDRYMSFCRPIFGDKTFEQVISFIKEAKKYIPWIEVSFLNFPDISLEACKNMADELGVEFRMRDYIETGNSTHDK